MAESVDTSTSEGDSPYPVGQDLNEYTQPTKLEVIPTMLPALPTKHGAIPTKLTNVTAALEEQIP